MTVMACVSANGNAKPPLTAVSGKIFQSTWKSSNMIPGATYAMDEYGWMTIKVFDPWFDYFYDTIFIFDPFSELCLYLQTI